ncbi:GAF and ANTAR domain-containing protein [Streptomyces sp. NPDC059785]|uniref:GAF and ANTAR domain-containing protein n=1 Tax=unclassified Streptomyces TaxID=2593676 RepID=UPI0036625173
MNPEGGPPDSASTAQHRAALARRRADQELKAAARQERLAERTGLELYARLARLHHSSAACHRTAAELQDAYARQLASWEGGQGAQPHFMTGVAEVCGTRSAALSLIGLDQRQLAVAASDDQAWAAQELEFVLGEGPAREAAVHRRPVSASGTLLDERWPGYGSGLAELGIDEVVAVPLSLGDNCVGSLALFDPRPGSGDPVFTEVADALTRTVVLGPEADAGLYGNADLRVVVHQASGMVSVQADITIDNALELIKARAFSEGRAVHDVAMLIVRGELRLG